MPELTPEQQKIRKQAFDNALARWETFQSLTKRITAIDSLHSTAIFGLLDLYEFHDGDISEGFGSNWLAIFIFDVLLEVAVNGAAAVANDPETIRKNLATIIDNMSSDLLLARETV